MIVYKKSIGILTFHFPDNFGAVLQCIALAYKLEQYDYFVEIINYTPKYHTQNYKIIQNPFVKNDKKAHFFENLGRIIKIFLLYYRVPLRVIKKFKFRSFLLQRVNITKKVYSNDQLKKLPGYDIYIAGSDQIWNPKWTNDIDNAYFLEFAEGKKFSYAASVGTEVEEKYISKFKQLLSSFSGISVREESLRFQLKKNGMDNVSRHIDPTLLLNSNDWEKIADIKKLKEKYLLVYLLEYNRNVEMIIEKIRRSYNFKVIDISPRKFFDNRKDVKHLRYCGPSEFLSYFANASFVVTNSFHGTVFSIVFQREFITFLHSKTPDRVNDLMHMLKLEGRIFTKLSNIDSLINGSIDYEEAQKILQNEIIKSGTYFENLK